MPDIETQRQRELARTHNANLPVAMTGKVVGVTFTPGYPDNLRALADMANRPPVPGPYPMFNGEMAQHFAERDWERALDARYQWEPLPAILVRNPDNQYDSNAIEVHVPALGDDEGMIGHLPRPIAARLAPSLDAGEQWAAHVTQVLIHPDHPENPGIEITIRHIPGDTQ